MTNRNSTRRASFVIAALASVAVVATSGVAEAQQLSLSRGGVKVRQRVVITDFEAQPAALTGTAKVRSRVFNPYDLSQSRLSIDPFGFFSFAPAATASSSPGATSSLATAPAVEAPAVADSAAAVVGENSAEDLGGSGAAVRPPFRPPVRSPFRPPPRPPFFPP